MKYHRISDPSSINPDEIKSKIIEGYRVVVQFSQIGYTENLLKELNELTKSLGRNLEIRFYGHYSGEFDASVLHSIPDAPNVSIDCLRKARNLDALSALRNLKEFCLGVFELEDTDLLSIDTIHGVERLTLGETRKANFDLSHLRRYSNLSKFHTTGHAKNIGVITSLPKLVSLSLSQIKNTNSLAFVTDIRHLTDLRIILGGRTSIAEIGGSELINLEVIRVRGLEDLGEIGRFPKLETLLIEDQIKLKRIQFGANPLLRDIKILNCKTLEHIDGIEDLIALEQLRIYQTALDYERLVCTQLPKSLKTLAFYTAKKKRDEEILRDLALRGYREFREKTNTQQVSAPDALPSDGGY